MIIGALEVGGTKMVCAVGDEKGTIKEQISIPTLTPQETLPKIKEYFYDKNIEDANRSRTSLRPPHQQILQ